MNDYLLPEEDALRYIQGLEDFQLPIPEDEFAFLKISPLKSTTFTNTYGRLASRSAVAWCKKHPATAITEALQCADVALLMAREQFIANPANKSLHFSMYAQRFIDHELAKLK